MNRTVQNAVAGVIGVIVLTATFNDLYLNFVRPWMKVPLIISGVLLVAVAVHGTYAGEWRRGSGGRHSGGHGGVRDGDVGDDEPAAAGEHVEDEPAGHEHRHLRMGWLLLAPFLILGVAAPPPLGAYAARSGTDTLTSTIQSADGLGALAGGQQLTMSLSEYSSRALYGPPADLEGKELTLTGFVTPAATESGWTITRMTLSCCAADAYAVRVEPRGGERLPDETWVQVTGTFVATPDRVSADAEPGLPVIQVSSVRRVDQPKNPYDSDAAAAG